MRGEGRLPQMMPDWFQAGGGFEFAGKTAMEEAGGMSGVSMSVQSLSEAFNGFTQAMTPAASEIKALADSARDAATSLTQMVKENKNNIPDPNTGGSVDNMVKKAFEETVSSKEIDIEAEKAKYPGAIWGSGAPSETKPEPPPEPTVKQPAVTDQYQE